MNFGFTEEQNLLRDQVERFMQDSCPITRVREISDAGGFDADFFDDGDVLSLDGDDSDDEAVGPLKEHKDKGKKKGGTKARKPASKKGNTAKKGSAAGAGTKRKSSGVDGGGGKKAKK